MPPVVESPKPNAQPLPPALSDQQTLHRLHARNVRIAQYQYALAKHLGLEVEDPLASVAAPVVLADRAGRLAKLIAAHLGVPELPAQEDTPRPPAAPAGARR